MTIDEPDRVDIIARNDAGEVILAAVAVGNWATDNQMLARLKAKVEAYAGFARSQDYRDDYGDAPARILLVTSWELTPLATKLIEAASSQLGIPIDVQVDPTMPRLP